MKNTSIKAFNRNGLLEHQLNRDASFVPWLIKRIAIDLDDGALVNYNKFGKTIKPITGLNDLKTKKKVSGFDWIDTSEIRD